MQASISRIALYVRDIAGVSAFYQKYFGFEPEHDNRDFVQLQSACGGCALVLLQAGKGQKTGQSCVKIVFDVPNVVEFTEQSRKEGLEFGFLHQADGYEYANARDPAQNLIQISNRRFRKSE
jgi:catechol 2,3-dioxygenase-like lactoylglutathione lyase family enzyme